jgi:predicted ATPase/class 3 adenylate cyclase
MALHTGTTHERDGDYFGPTLNHLSRLRDAAHGGQVLLSDATTALVQDRLPEGVQLRDLGEHRLRDVPRRWPVHQLAIWGLPADFPALRFTEDHPTNLSPQRDRLLGRERELTEVCELLRQNGVGLVTLTGPGGTGKTRLGLAVAAVLLDAFADGVFVVDLAPLADPALVPAAIGQALGVREGGGTSLPEALAAYLRAKALLLVLDNVEHLLPAAPVVGDLLAAPRLKVLATSRAPLNLRGEREFPVPPLALPAAGASSANDISRSAAAALFVERARDVRPDFRLTDADATAIGELCRRLDGLPLAIELAAARVRVLTPSAMLGRLVGVHGRAPLLQMITGGGPDRPARQQTLHATIRWSYELLDGREQRLFRRMSVFVGGCALDAVEAVCTEDDEARAGLLDALTTLVAQNLVLRIDESGRPGSAGQMSEPRFGMLETIREFALDRLAESDDRTTLAARHAAFFHALALRADAHMFGPERERWLGRLTVEQGNLRAVLQWGLSGGDLQLALATGAALQFWFITESVREGRQALEQLLAQPSATAPTPARARALRALGWLAIVQGDFAAARARLDESAAYWRAVGNSHELAHALCQHAMLSAAGTEPPIIAIADEAVQTARAAASPFATAFSLSSRAALALRRRDWTAARTDLEEAIEIARRHGARAPGASFLKSAALVDSFTGDLDSAATKYGQALALFRSLDNHAPPHLIAQTLGYLGDVEYRRHNLDAAAAQYAEGLRLNHRVGAVGDGVRCIAALGRVACRKQEWDRAARILGAADGLMATYQFANSTGVVQTAQERQATEALVAQTRTALGEAAFIAAWEEGRALSLDAAVALALERTSPA